VPHGNFLTGLNKKMRGPSDIELKKMVMIPEYLAKDMVNAVGTQGTAYPEGPPFGAVNEAPTCPLLVFINSKSGGRLGSELKTHFIELISPNQVSITNMWLFEHSKTTLFFSWIICCFSELLHTLLIGVACFDVLFPDAQDTELSSYFVCTLRSWLMRWVFLGPLWMLLITGS
jgi:hypothetical protein